MRLLNKKDYTKFNDQKVINYIEECNNNHNIYTHILHVVALKMRSSSSSTHTESTQHQTKHS